MTLTAWFKVLLMMTRKIAIIYVNLGQINFFRGGIRMLRVTIGAIRYILRFFLIMRYVPMRVDHVAAFGLERRLPGSQFFKRVAGDARCGLCCRFSFSSFSCGIGDLYGIDQVHAQNESRKDKKSGQC